MQIVEEKLKEIEEKYCHLFHNANDAVYMYELTATGVPSCFTEVNKVALKRLGYSWEELQTMSLLEITDPESADELFRVMKQLLQKGKVIYQTTHITKHKFKIPVQISASLFQSNGKTIVISIERDLIERKWTERRLNRALEQYKSLVEHNPNVVYSLDMDGNILSINEVACEITGYPVEAILNRHFSEFVKETLREKAIAYFLAASKGKPNSHEVAIQTSNGSFATFQVTNIPIVVEGKIEGVYGIGKDITLRKQAEEALFFTQQELKKTNHRLLQAQIIARMGNWEWDLQTKKINYWSQQIDDIIGIGLQEDFSFKKFLDLVHPADRELVKNSIRMAIEGKKHFTVENRLVLRDGSIRFIQSQAEVISNESNQPSQIVGIMQDVTERRNTEELLRKSDKLTVAGQLAAGVAHEIRNPLASIKGFVQLLELGMNKPEYFQIMLSEINRMEEIINEFLLLAKPQAINFGNTDIRTLLDNVITLLNTQAIMNNVQIIKQCDSEIPLLCCDENQIKQVFINLLKNGIDAMDKGGTIRVQTSYTKGSILTKIIDNGCGIPEDRLHRIAEPFYSTKEKGTGLGLMITDKIIKEHYGQLKIQSEVNQGTTVEVHLPVSRHFQ